MPLPDENRVRRIEALVAKIEAIADPAIRNDARQLMESILELHGAGLERIMEIAHDSGEPGRFVITHLAADPLVSSLLVLHGIHPQDIEARVRKAVDRYSGIEVVQVSDGVVQLRIPIGRPDLRQTALELIGEAAPDARDIVIEDALIPGGFVPLSSLAPPLSSET